METIGEMNIQRWPANFNDDVAVMVVFFILAVADQQLTDIHAHVCIFFKFKTHSCLRVSNNADYE